MAQSKRTGRKNARRRSRGGAGAPNPSSYSSGTTYVQAVAGNINTPNGGQYGRTFDINGPGNNNTGNGLIGLQGQLVAKGFKGGSKRSSSSSKSKKGGSFWGLGEVIRQAIVPFTLLGLQQTYNRRGKSSYNRTKKYRVKR